MEVNQRPLEYTFLLHSKKEKKNLQDDLAALCKAFKVKHKVRPTLEWKDPTPKERLTGGELAVQIVILLAGPIVADLYKALRDEVVKPILEKYELLK